MKYNSNPSLPPPLRQGYDSPENPDDASAGCLLTAAETCSVCAEGEGERAQGKKPTIVKNYRQGGLLRLVVEFSRPDYSALSQVRLCPRNGKITCCLHCPALPCTALSIFPDQEEAVTEECLEKQIMVTSRGEDLVNITHLTGDRQLKLLYQLPPDLTCRRLRGQKI